MQAEISNLVSDIIKSLYDLEFKVDIIKSDLKFGDFSTNVALKLASSLRKSPLDISNEIASSVKNSNSSIFKDVNVTAPGFINFVLNDNQLLNSQYLQKKDFYSNKRIVIETNNPNPFKSMHIGHALNAVIGDTLANFLEFGGGQVHRVSYHGDIGIHVGKSMWAILNYINGDLDKLDQIPVIDRSKFLSSMYVEGAKAYDENPEAKEEIINLSNQSYLPENELFKNAYLICRGWSFDKIDSILSKLGSKPIERRYLESESEPIGREIVKSNLNKYFFESDSAIIFKGEDYGLFTTVFVSSSGRGLYAARDMGLIKLKQNDFSPDKSFVVTAIEQKDYFKVAIKASELIGIAKEGETENITTGTVKLSTGKMSSRSGNVIDIDWLIDSIRNEFKKFNEQVDSELVSGALRYQLLKVRLGGDIVFDIEQSVSLQGNSGPYLMYSHARARSIIKKVGVQPEELSGNLSFDPKERQLALKMYEYNSVLLDSTRQLKPHSICNYLYELSQVFNSFYEVSPVLNSDRQNVRVILVNHYANILRHGLSLLGISAPDKM